MGDEAEDILRSTNITTDERKVFETVLDKFDQFFKVRKNVIFERAKFNRRCQGNTESVSNLSLACITWLRIVHVHMATSRMK